MKKASKKAIAKKPASTQLATNDLFAQMHANAGKGIENADRDSFAIPFILCLQSQSPQLETVDGAKAGRFLNSVTNEVFEAVRVVPVYFERQFLRWVDRDSGGGFKGAYHPLEVEEMLSNGDAERSEDGLRIRIGDNESLSDTRQHYVLVQDKSGSWTPAVIACASTQIKKSKNWLTQINNFKIEHDGELFNPPSWARIYSVTSVKESNNKGSWHGISIAPDSEGLVSPELYALGSKFYDQIIKGRVKVQHEDLAQAEASSDSEEF